MTASLWCNNCQDFMSIYGFNVKEDLKYTKFAHLLGKEIKTEDDFEQWIKQQEDAGHVQHTDSGSLIIDGEYIYDAFERFNNNGEKCPICGSADCSWH